MERQRRAHPRQAINWGGEYIIEGDADDRWRECRVVDVSTAGAGLELLEMPPGLCEGRIIVAVRLHGDIKNSGPGSDGRFRVGIEFAGPTAHPLG